MSNIILQLSPRSRRWVFEVRCEIKVHAQHACLHENCVCFAWEGDKGGKQIETMCEHDMMIKTP